MGKSPRVPPGANSLPVAAGGTGQDAASGICPAPAIRDAILSLSVYADVAHDHKGGRDLPNNQLLFAFHAETAWMC